MKLFNPFDMADYKRRLPTPIEGTCQWIWKHPLFLFWLDGSGSCDNDNHNTPLLWLTGHPGCGKTMLSYSLARQLEQHPSDSQKKANVLIYFCDDKVNTQKDARLVLIGLIAQLVQRNRRMVRHVRRVFEVQGGSMLQSFSALWSVFERIIKDRATNVQGRPLYIIIDALDECESSSCDDLLAAIRELVLFAEDQKDTGLNVKFLLTSRPSLGQISYTVKNFLEKYQLPIDQGQPGYDKDIHVFIQQKVNEIAIKRRCSDEVKDFLLQTLSSRADQTFLWLHMVIARLEQSFLASANDFRNIVGNLPPDLETMYLGFLCSIPAQNQDAAVQMLQLLLASSRPLLLEEVNLAFTIKPTHNSAGDVAKDCQSDMAGAMLGILGPLVRVSDSKVSLIHQTAKDFLLSEKSEAAARTLAGTCPGLSTVTTETSALRMASACIRYLLLKDFSRNWYGGHGPSSSGSDSSGCENFSSSDSDSANSSSYLDLPGLTFFGEDEDGLVFHEPGDLDVEFSQKLDSTHQFYRYSALHWAQHLALCEDQAPGEVLQAARKLLDIQNKSCQNWLRFYKSEVAGSKADDVPDTESPAILAAYFNLRATLVDILENDDLSQRDKDQALLFGAKAGHDRIVNVLLDTEADQNYRVIGSDKTPLTEAAAHGRTECVVQLLRGNTNDPKYAAIALDLAAGNGHHDIVKHLLSWHDITHPTSDLGGSSLIRAACAGHLPIISTLCKHKAIDTNHRDKRGRTPLSWAAGDGMDAVVKYLLKQQQKRSIDLDVNLTDNEGRTPLSWAAGNGHASAIQVLLSKCKKQAVDLAQADRNGRTPLSWACGQGHEDAVCTLLENGAGGHVNEGDIDGWTPLAWAIQQDRPGIVEALFDYEKIDLEKLEGSRTILSWAVEYGHLNVVRTLLRKGADPASAAHQVEELRARGKFEMVNELNWWMNRKE